MTSVAGRFPEALLIAPSRARAEGRRFVGRSEVDRGFDEEARGDLRARDDVVDVREGACAREVVDARRVAAVPVTKS